ncbi:MAG: glutathione S-transferase family protein [Caldimonas sp.]
MLTLYGTKGPCSAAIEAALDLAGLTYRQVDTASCAPVNGLVELTRTNPKAQVPTLVLADGSILTESAAILIHLGLCHPASGLMPSDPARRAQQICGLVYIAANCQAGAGILNHRDNFHCDVDEPTRTSLLTRGRASLHELWETFADQFPFTPWLAGDRLGALDLLAATVSMWNGARRHLEVARPEFHALLLRVGCDPRIAPVWKRNWVRG